MGTMVSEDYKQTEVGVIPKEWNLKKFEDVLTGFSSGATPYRSNSDYYNGDIRWITSGELNYNVINDTIEKITKEAVKKTNLKILPKGTFLIAITGLEAKGTRGSCGIVGKESTTNQSCMALFPTKELLIDYLFHYYVNYGDSLALEYCQGTKQQSYTGTIVKKLPIVLPPLPEQQAIAEALSDVDVLLTSLEQLIAKKRNIKQGTMQHLLTGKKRLPGFTGKWEEKKLGDICNYQNGSSIEKYFNNDDGFKVVSIGNYSSEGRYIENQTFIDRGIEKLIKRFILNKNDLTMILNDKTSNGTIIGRVLLIKESGKYVFNQRTMRLAPSNDIFPLFLYYKINSDEVHNLIVGLAKPGTQIYVNTNDILELAMVFPKTIEEQKAIAQILSDIDAEIEALEQKRDKYNAIKQGMMQELLTGRVRLRV